MAIPAWAFPEVSEAVRDFQRKIQKEKWQNSVLGQIAKVDDEFTGLEEAFVKQREAKNDPEVYDNFMLRVFRNCLASKLMLKTDNENVKKYIGIRVNQLITLPELPSKPKTALDLLVKKALAAREGTIKND
ncbi:MAG: hypothetical protein C4562_05375 [Actinobacteria bacterium]|nr:MAG: hypothetical protein C4562_05375 [Actinomycetota bacterium]